MVKAIKGEKIKFKIRIEIISRNKISKSLNLFLKIKYKYPKIPKPRQILTIQCWSLIKNKISSFINKTSKIFKVSSMWKKSGANIIKEPFIK